MVPILVCAIALAPRLDADGVPLPAEAVARVGSALWRHPVAVGPPAVSADGQFVYTATATTDIVVWDVATGRAVHRFGLPFIAEPPPRSRPVPGPLRLNQGAATPTYGLDHRRLAPAPDGRLWVTDFQLGEGSVRTVNPATGRVLAVRRIDAPLGQRAELSADGRRAAVHVIDVTRQVSIDTETHALRVLDLDRLAGAYTVAAAGHVRAFGFSPDGRRLAVADDAAFRLLDAATGKPVRTVAHPAGRWVSGLRFSPDGSVLAVWLCGADARREQRLELWPTAGGAAVPTTINILRERWRAENDVVFRPDGRQLAVNTEANTWQLVDATTGAIGASVAVPRSLPYGAAYSPDGHRLFVAGVGHLIDGPPFNNGGTSLTTCAGFLAPVDVTARPPVVLHDARPNRYLGTFTRDGDYAAVYESTLLRWNGGTGRVVESRLPLTLSGGENLQYAFSRDGERLAVVVPTAEKHAGAVAVIHLATGRLTTLPTGPQVARDLVFSPDGRTLFAAVGEKQIGWDVATGRAKEQPWTEGGTNLGLVSLDFDGRWLATRPLSILGDPPPVPDTPVRLYDTTAWHGWKAPTWELRPTGWTHRTEVLPGGRQVVVAAGHRDGSYLELWDGPPGRRRWRVRTAAYPLAVSPDGRTLLARNGDAAELIETATGLRRHTFAGLPSPPAYRLPHAFSPDGRLLATTGEDGLPYLWDVRGELQKPPTADVAAAWEDLGSADAAVAFRAVRRLAGFPDQSLPLLRAKLPPVPAVDATQVAAWVAALDAPAFADREAAAKGLKALGDLARPALEAAWKTTESAEARSRIEGLVDAIDGRPATADALRAVRAVEAVEWIGTPAAGALLARWAGGAAGARLTREAKAARDRGR